MLEVLRSASWNEYLKNFLLNTLTETCSEPSQSFKMELFSEIVNGFHLLTLYVKSLF